MCLSRSCCKCDMASTTNTTNTSTTNTCSSSIEDSDNCYLSCPATSDICSNATCHKKQNATNSAQNAKFCNLYKSRKTKSYVCLLIIISATLVQTAFAKPTQSPGQKLILHTPEHRYRYHLQLIKKERSTVQPTTKFHHHLHLRSADNMQENTKSGSKQKTISCIDIAENDLTKMKESQNLSFNQTLWDFETYVNLTHHNNDATNFNEEQWTKLVLMQWGKYNLSLPHPYANDLERDFYKVPNYSNFKELHENEMSIELLLGELRKIYKTLQILKKAFEEVVSERDRNFEELAHDINSTKDVAEATKFFNETALHYIGANCSPVEDLIKKIEEMLKDKIPKGEKELQNSQTSENPQVQNESKMSAKTYELLLGVEYLRVANHLRHLYKILIDKCLS